MEQRRRSFVFQNRRKYYFEHLPTDLPFELCLQAALRSYHESSRKKTWRRAGSLENRYGGNVRYHWPQNFTRIEDYNQMCLALVDYKPLTLLEPVCSEIFAMVISGLATHPSVEKFIRYRVYDRSSTESMVWTYTSTLSLQWNKET